MQLRSHSLGFFHRGEGMINRLWGKLIDGGEKRVLLQSSFIEWEIIIGEQCKSVLFQQDTANANVYTYLLHREDAMVLYGFSSIFVRDTFLAMQKVNGIGARQALSIVSSLDAVHIWQSIQSQDVARLVVVPGLGKKKAEQMILQLKDMVPELPKQANEKQATSDVILGLVQMGYTHEEIHQAYARLNVDSTESEADVFNALIRILGGGT